MASSAVGSHEAEIPYAEAERSFFFKLEVAVLVLWGAVLAYFVASGKVVNFLSTTGIFREQALIGGLALLVLAVFNFAMRNRFPGCGHDHSTDGHDHHHEESTWMSRIVTIFILVTPVLMAINWSRQIVWWRPMPPRIIPP
jgi:Domain of unknown function (DUF1980)